MRRALLLAACLTLVPSPASATHGYAGGDHWRGTGIRVLKIADLIRLAYSGDQLERWRSFRDGAFADWEASGVVRFELQTNLTKRQKASDGFCIGTGTANKPQRLLGGADILLCRHADWAIFQWNIREEGSVCIAEGYPGHDPTKCHIESSIIAINSGFAAGYATCEPNCQKYVAHELGHSLGLGHSSDCYSVMSYCSGWYHPSAHDLEEVARLHDHAG